MNNVKLVVAKNIQKLRKQNKLTQAELAEKLNYSDKAISRWESGEVTPDVEVLNKIAEIFDVEITSLFDENLNLEKASVVSKKQRVNKTTIMLLCSCFIWVCATVIYVYGHLLLNENFWLIFIYAVPATVLIILIFNYLWGKASRRYIFYSVLIWTVIASIYITFLSYNLWMIFLIGAPVQVAIVLWAKIKIDS